METAVILFNDGTSIEAEVNGSCYITDSKPEFPGDLTGIVISAESGVRHIDNGQIIEAASVDGRYWFAVEEIPAEVIKEAELQAKLDYLAMMTDVDLEEVL